MSSDEGSRNKTKVKKKTSNLKMVTNAALRNEISSLSQCVASNSDAIKKLNELPNKMDRLLELLNNNPDSSDKQDVTDGQNATDEPDPIDALIRADHDNENELGHDEELMGILNATQPTEDFGPELQKDVAFSVKRLFTNKQTKEKSDTIKGENRLPSNCKELGVPKVNTEIWNMLSPKSKQIDYSHQIIQQQLSLASVMNARTAEMLFTAGPKIEKSIKDQLLKVTLESLAVIGNAMQDISQRRKQDIRPFLSKEASAICSSSKTTKWLFGDNITEQLKSAKTTANVLRSSTARPSFRGLRFTPYKNQSPGQVRTLNWQGPPPFRRGGFANRGFRGRRQSTRQDFQFNRSQ